MAITVCDISNTFVGVVLQCEVVIEDLATMKYTLVEKLSSDLFILAVT